MSKTKNGKAKLSALWQTLLTFALAQVVSLVTAIVIWQEQDFTPITMPVPWYTFVLSFSIATLFVLLAIKYLKGGRFFILFFYLLVAIGAMEVFSSFLISELALLCVLIILIIRLSAPSIWIHNLAIIVGLAGISASIGKDLTPMGVIVILIVLSVYDYIAVYKTKTMVKMFKGLLSRGVIFSIIIPEHVKNWTVPLQKVRQGEGFMFLGTGDIALPMIFAASVLPEGLIASLGVIIGSLVGVLCIHLIFNIQKKRAPMPALPPIAFFSILGYLISMFI
ncbi:MAG TPA: presenilin family intramembrane aspartyl protease [Candidatus Bipolaricaulota bacterium]|nr:presenilin family intramembrane aspartyl protease [Candidatus Bipolaricaulota bacterium]